MFNAVQLIQNSRGCRIVQQKHKYKRNDPRFGCDFDGTHERPEQVINAVVDAVEAGNDARRGHGVVIGSKGLVDHVRRAK